MGGGGIRGGPEAGLVGGIGDEPAQAARVDLAGSQERGGPRDGGWWRRRTAAGGSRPRLGGQWRSEPRPAERTSPSVWRANCGRRKRASLAVSGGGEPADGGRLRGLGAAVGTRWRDGAKAAVLMATTNGLLLLCSSLSLFRARPTAMWRLSSEDGSFGVLSQPARRSTPTIRHASPTSPSRRPSTRPARPSPRYSHGLHDPRHER